MVDDRADSPAGPRLPEARFRTVVEQSPYSTVIFRPDGRPLFANAAFARLWGVSEDDLPRLLARYDILQDEELAAKGAMEGVRRGFAGEVVDLPLLEYEGARSQERTGVPTRRLWVRGRVYPVRDEAGEVVEVVVIHEDHTERVEAERERAALQDQLRQQQRLEALGRLATGIAHDFNNVLMAILGRVDLLGSGPRDEDSVTACLVEVRRAAERGAELARQLLTFHRPGQQAVREVDLAALVDETVGLVRRLIGEDIRVVVRHGRRPLAVVGSGSQLVQVLMNLCLNARDAMPEGGTLVLETEPGAGEDGAARAILRVSDTGHGMAPEVAARAFDPYFTTRAGGGGSGIGLATVHAVVSAHGGTVDLQTSPGHGTVFEVRLPSAGGAGAAPRTAQEPPGPAAAAAPAGELILVVEDEEMVRVVIERSLRRAGYRVLEASSGDEGLARFLARQGEVALAVLDVVLPGLSGPRLLERLHAVRPDLPALFCSGFTADEDLRAWAQNPRVGSLPKPFGPTELVERVRALLSVAREGA